MNSSTRKQSTSEGAAAPCGECGGPLRLVSLGKYASTLGCRACGHSEVVNTTVEMMRKGEELRAAAIESVSS